MTKGSALRVLVSAAAAHCTREPERRPPEASDCRLIADAILEVFEDAFKRKPMSRDFERLGIPDPRVYGPVERPVED